MGALPLTLLVNRPVSAKRPPWVFAQPELTSLKPTGRTLVVTSALALSAHHLGASSLNVA